MTDRKLYVVGMGPGNYEDMTIRAEKAIKESDVIAGYTVYCDLLKPYFTDKEYISTPMMGEEKRVLAALEMADKGHTVSLVCSGDAGVYGMAGLAVMMGEDFPNVQIEVIPGITAALSGGALIGAPLIHDFCIVSMSDRLTDMSVILKRLKSAAAADFVIVLYNPESKSRSGYLKKACEAVIDICGEDRICAIVRNIGREGQKSSIMTLKEMEEAEADMFSTVFIGNSQTMKIKDRMVTPRGYKSEKR